MNKLKSLAPWLVSGLIAVLGIGGAAWAFSGSFPIGIDTCNNCIFTAPQSSVDGGQSLGGSGTRSPNGLSADTTSPVAGEVRGSTLTITGAGSTATSTVTGHRITTGTAPAISAAGSGYSVAAVVAQSGSSDTDGSVTTTIATANAGSLTMVFATPYLAAPVCVVTNGSSATDTFYVSSTLTTMGINFPAGLTGGVHTYYYNCVQ